MKGLTCAIGSRACRHMFSILKHLLPSRDQTHGPHTRAHPESSYTGTARGSRLVSTQNSSTLQREFGNRAKEEGLDLASALL